MSRPFLTVITRCCRRPHFLARNIVSVYGQTDRDLEQIYIPDFEHRGLEWANRQFAANLGRVDGRYVFLLDDDDVFVEPRAVELLKGVQGSPGAVMVKNSRPQLAPHVLPRVWGRRDMLKITVTNGSCFVVRADFWRKHAYRFGAKAAGDWNFMRALRDDADCEFAWLDRVLSESLQLGRSSVEAGCPPDWFQRVAAIYDLAEVAPGDWRLPLHRWTELRIWQALHKKGVPSLGAGNPGQRALPAPPEPAPVKKHSLLGRRS